MAAATFLMGRKPLASGANSPGRAAPGRRICKEISRQGREMPARSAKPVNTMNSRRGCGSSDATPGLWGHPARPMGFLCSCLFLPQKNLANRRDLSYNNLVHRPGNGKRFRQVSFRKPPVDARRRGVRSFPFPVGAGEESAGCAPYSAMSGRRLGVGKLGGNASFSSRQGHERLYFFSRRKKP